MGIITAVTEDASWLLWRAKWFRSRGRQGLGPTAALAQTCRVYLFFCLDVYHVSLYRVTYLLTCVDLLADCLRHGKPRRIFEHRTHQHAAVTAAEISSSITTHVPQGFASSASRLWIPLAVCYSNGVLEILASSKVRLVCIHMCLCQCKTG
jgi:hypothetical protein